MDVCVIACYYIDVHARPEASSDMSVFTITAVWLLLANFNRRTVASDTNGGIVIEHLAVA